MTKKANKKKHKEIIDRVTGKGVTYAELIEGGYMTEEEVYVEYYLSGPKPGIKSFAETVYEARRDKKED